jgi:5'-methylthioadenosine phosphorylase
MKIGVIGGSGLEKGDILQNLEVIEVETPYGKPSSKIKKGTLGKAEVYILSRHGENHEITPTHVNNKANIYALSKLGCKTILATTAVGSLRQNIHPGDFVIANQFIDFTKHRDITFFDDFKKEVKHTSLAEPFSNKLRGYLIDSCGELNLPHHKIGTIWTIEGPRFSTRAESFMFQKFAHVINMSTAPEAILAAEAEIEYAVVAMSTDYDCWKKEEEPVTWAEIERTMKQNADNVKKVLTRTIEKIANEDTLTQDIEIIKNSITNIPNFPKEGVIFRDVTSLIQDTSAMKKVINIFYNRYKTKNIDAIAGIESRGFIFGSLLASRLDVPFVLIRKKGKLPRETESVSYETEYSTDTIEIHKDAIKPGQNILLIDDLVATGGSALAGAQLINKLGGEVMEIGLLIDLPGLGGKKKIQKAGFNIFTVIEFEGE